jgi:hypothetical protein
VALPAMLVLFVRGLVCAGQRWPRVRNVVSNNGRVAVDR